MAIHQRGQPPLRLSGSPAEYITELIERCRTDKAILEPFASFQSNQLNGVASANSPCYHVNNMSDTKFDPTRPVQTRDGKPARIICTDHKGLQGETIVATVVTASDGRQAVRDYMADGSFTRTSPSPEDLVNVPDKRQVSLWLNIYADDYTAHQTRDSADYYQTGRRLACKRITVDYVVEEGL